MTVEIITIGDELLTGFVVDTNSAFIARKLTEHGLTVSRISSVADTVEAMEEAFRLGLRRSRVVIVTGGLGPTDDDLTKRAIVKLFKRNLIFHEEILAELTKRFTRRGIEMPKINQNQALLPQGATFFPNKYGSAVGICIAEDGRIFIALPGVPREMKQILVDEVINYLTAKSSGHSMQVITLRTTGIVESRLAEIIKPCLKIPSGVKLAYLPSYSGVVLRVLSSAETEEEATEKAREVSRQLESVCGKYIYGGEEDSLQSVIGQLLKDNDRTLSVAESCTGGELGMLITEVPGSSKYFLGGIEAYSNDAKINLLGVDKNIIEEHGAVSEECAVAMAKQCRDKFDSDYALSITGVAGPDGGTDEKPVGTVWVGISAAHINKARKFSFGTDRPVNRTRAAYSALEMLRRDILDIT